MIKVTRFILISAFFVGAYAQSIVVESASGSINLPPNQALVTFVPTTSSSLDGAIKDTALSSAQDKAVAATLLKAVPIPVVGPFAAPLVTSAFNKLHPKTVTGFSIAFVKGLSATTAIAPGRTSFEIPAQSLEGATPTLLRMKLSTKDSTRIVRSLRLSVKASGASVTPDDHNTTVLGDEQDVIPSHTDVRDGNVILTPEAALESGEYAMALVPPARTVSAPVGKVWDFRVEARAIASATAGSKGETRVIDPGQTTARVIETFGIPDRVVKFGSKDIYYYKDLKVIFTNGKAVDVQ